MKKKNFVSLVMGTVGGILFALGMCMCMLPQWNAFTQGVVVSAVGAVVLLGIVVGIVGIVLLICLIPLCRGLQ